MLLFDSITYSNQTIYFTDSIVNLCISRCAKVAKDKRLKYFAYFVSVASFRDVKGLNKSSDVTHNQSIASCTGHHTNRGHPSLHQTIWRKATVAYAEHMRQGLKQGPRILLKPVGILKPKKQHNYLIAKYLLK